MAGATGRGPQGYPMPNLAPAPSLAWNTVWILPGPNENIKWGPPGILAAGQRAGHEWEALLSSRLPSGHKRPGCSTDVHKCVYCPSLYLSGLSWFCSSSAQASSHHWAEQPVGSTCSRGQCPVSPGALVRESPALMDRGRLCCCHLVLGFPLCNYPLRGLLWTLRKVPGHAQSCRFPGK